MLLSDSLPMPCADCLLSAQVLLEPFHIDRKGEIPAGQQPTYAMRLFSWQVLTQTGRGVRSASQA